MKINAKMNKMVLLSALMIAIIGTIGTVSAEEFNLTAGGGDEIIGVVEVTNDGYNLSVIYTITEGGWCISETHLHIANESEDGIPQTKKGNPKVGQFDYSEEHEPCVDGYTYEIPLNGLSGEVYIAAHAAVQLAGVDPITEEPTIEYESAWGYGTEFVEDRNWAMYITYTIEEPEL